MGAFGDSLTVDPSYAYPLSQMLNMTEINLSEGGIGAATLLNMIPGSQAQAMSDHSVVLIGTNPLTDPAATTIGQLQQIYALLRDVHPVTILPKGNAAGMNQSREDIRLEINDWIRAQPNMSDVESVMGDGSSPINKLKAIYDSGDGVHLNSAGKTALATAIYQQGFG